MTLKLILTNYRLYSSSSDMTLSSIFGTYTIGLALNSSPPCIGNVNITFSEVMLLVHICFAMCLMCPSLGSFNPHFPSHLQ